MRPSEHPHSLTHSLIHAPTQTHNHSLSLTHRLTHPDTQIHILSHTSSLTHPQSLTHPDTHTHSSLTHSHTQSLTHSSTHTHTHTHPDTQSLSHTHTRAREFLINIHIIQVNSRHYCHCYHGALDLFFGYNARVADLQLP